MMRYDFLAWDYAFSIPQGWATILLLILLKPISILVNRAWRSTSDYLENLLLQIPFFGFRSMRIQSFELKPLGGQGGHYIQIQGSIILVNQKESANALIKFSYCIEGKEYIPTTIIDKTLPLKIGPLQSETIGFSDSTKVPWPRKMPVKITIAATDMFNIAHKRTVMYEGLMKK